MCYYYKLRFTLGLTNSLYNLINSFSILRQKFLLKLMYNTINFSLFALHFYEITVGRTKCPEEKGIKCVDIISLLNFNK